MPPESGPSAQHLRILKILGDANSPGFGLNAAVISLFGNNTRDLFITHGNGAFILPEGEDLNNPANIYRLQVPIGGLDGHRPVVSAELTGDPGGQSDALICDASDNDFNGAALIMEGGAGISNPTTSGQLGKILGPSGSQGFCVSADSTKTFQGANVSAAVIGSGAQRATILIGHQGVDHRNTLYSSPPAPYAIFITGSGSFGLRVKFSRDGESLIISAPFESSGAGRVYVFKTSELSSTGAEERSVSTIPDRITFIGPSTSDRFGKTSVDDCTGFLSGFPACVLVASEDAGYVWAIGYDPVADAGTTIDPDALPANQKVKIPANGRAISIYNPTTNKTSIAFVNDESGVRKIYLVNPDPVTDASGNLDLSTIDGTNGVVIESTDLDPNSNFGKWISSVLLDGDTEPRLLVSQEGKDVAYFVDNPSNGTLVTQHAYEVSTNEDTPATFSNIFKFPVTPTNNLTLTFKFDQAVADISFLNTTGITVNTISAGEIGLVGDKADLESVQLRVIPGNDWNGQTALSVTTDYGDSFKPEHSFRLKITAVQDPLIQNPSNRVPLKLEVSPDEPHDLTEIDETNFFRVDTARGPSDPDYALITMQFSQAYTGNPLTLNQGVPQIPAFAAGEEFQLNSTAFSGPLAVTALTTILALTPEEPGFFAANRNLLVGGLISFGIFTVALGTVWKFIYGVLFKHKIDALADKVGGNDPDAKVNRDLSKLKERFAKALAKPLGVSDDFKTDEGQGVFSVIEKLIQELACEDSSIGEHGADGITLESLYSKKTTGQQRDIFIKRVAELITEKKPSDATNWSWLVAKPENNDVEAGNGNIPPHALIARQMKEETAERLTQQEANGRKGMMRSDSAKRFPPVTVSQQRPPSRGRRPEEFQQREAPVRTNSSDRVPPGYAERGQDLGQGAVVESHVGSSSPG